MESPEVQSYSVNFDNILASNNASAIIKSAVLHIKNSTYFSVGQFMSSLSNQDLNYLLDSTETLDDERGAELLLLALVLAEGEGLGPASTDSALEMLNALIAFLATTSLYRKGLANVIFNNMSFAPECNNLPIGSLKK